MSVQRGLVPIFGTDNPEHLRSDLEVVRAPFELSEEEMAAIATLDQGMHMMRISEIVERYK